MQRMIRGVAALVLTALAVPALAQQPTPAQTNAIRHACRADYQTHCASVPTGGSAALSCLQQNAPSLSPGCQSALAALKQGNTAAAPSPPPPAAHGPGAAAPAPPMTAREELALMRHACAHDYRLFCSGVRPGGGRAVACLAEHGESLSPSCRSAMMAARQSQ